MNLPNLGRVLLAVVNVLALPLLGGLMWNGNDILVGAIGCLLLLVNAAYPLVELAAKVVRKTPAGVAVDVVSSVIASSHPAAKFNALAARVVDALLNFQITAAEAESVLVPAVKSLADDAEKAAPDVLGSLKQEAAQ